MFESLHTTSPNVSLPALPITTSEVVLESPSGPLRGKLSAVQQAPIDHAVVLCSGLAIGMDGEFVQTIERCLLSLGLAQASIRFNFSGHSQDGANSDIRGFTFSRALDDFCAAVQRLQDEGAARVTAVCSSTGAQPALLASCTDSVAARPDRIIARGAVTDCFANVMDKIPPPTLDTWRTQGEFQFPVGGTLVRMGTDLLSDIERWRVDYDLASLKVPVTLIHGRRDEVVPLSVVERSIERAPAELLTLHVLDNAGHDFAGDAHEPHLRLLIEQFQDASVARPALRNGEMSANPPLDSTNGRTSFR